MLESAARVLVRLRLRAVANLRRTNHSVVQLNIANPVTGQQKLIELDDEKKLQHIYEKKLSQELNGELIGDEFKGFAMKIMGGQDKEGFAMKQGVLTNRRVKLLMHPGTQGCRGYGMRPGERKRKSVRGCIVSPAISVLHLMIVSDGGNTYEGLTDNPLPRRLGPKRASKLRKLFMLSKEDDVRKYVIRREIVSKKDGVKPKSKAPKIQRLVTPATIQRKRRARSAKIAAKKKSIDEKKAYESMLATRASEARAVRRASEKKRSEEAKTAKATKAKAAAATKSTKKSKVKA